MLALYGPVGDPDQLLKSFLSYDNSTGLLAGGVPWSLVKGATKSFDDIKEFASRDPLAAYSKVIRDRYEACHGKCDPDQEACLNASFFWASLSNTIPATTWAVKERKENKKEKLIENVS